MWYDCMSNKYHDVFFKNVFIFSHVLDYLNSLIVTCIHLKSVALHKVVKFSDFVTRSMFFLALLLSIYSPHHTDRWRIRLCEASKPSSSK